MRGEVIVESGRYGPGPWEEIRAWAVKNARSLRIARTTPGGWYLITNLSSASGYLPGWVGSPGEFQSDILHGQGPDLAEAWTDFLRRWFRDRLTSGIRA